MRARWPITKRKMNMEQTLERRCKVALECLPDARYRTMLAELLDDLLAHAAVPVVQPQKPVAYVWYGHVGPGARSLRWRMPSQWDYTTRVDPLYLAPAPERARYSDSPAGEPAGDLSDVQRHITDMLVAHRDMIEAQQRGDSAAEVLAVQRMEAARSALADARPGEEQLDPFWCHEQSHDRPRCETQCAECAECAEDGVAEPSGEELSQAPSLDEILAVVLLYAANPTPHNERKVRCALRDALTLERQPQVRAMTARAWEERSRRDGARDD